MEVLQNPRLPELSPGAHQLVEAGGALFRFGMWRIHDKYRKK